ncbi:MAG: hypothetical protein HC824_07315 [Synechococcales cyanobacterium RM1_1_8]|nr:hypothetical protein [Synechococcales cyanobacterium RM1_1_8]
MVIEIGSGEQEEVFKFAQKRSAGLSAVELLGVVEVGADEAGGLFAGRGKTGVFEQSTGKNSTRGVFTKSGGVRLKPPLFR